MRRIRIGSDTYLEPADLRSHLHGVGLSRTGKSKLIELIARDLITYRIPCCIIDPHALMYGELLDWLTVMNFERPITLFDPSRPAVGFNPFASQETDPARIMTKAERMLSATLLAWGVTDPTSTPRLTKILTCLYYLAIEQQLSMDIVDAFLAYRDGRREAILRRTQSLWVQAEMERLYALPRRDFENYIESTANRLRMFVHPQVRKVLSAPPLDVKGIIDSGGILLVNLKPSGEIGRESNRVLGTLLVNEFWEVTYTRPIGESPEFYLVIDECHKYMTPDIGAMLAEGAKYGLHLMLFHQDESQVRSFAGALKNAQTKIRFSTEERPLPTRAFELRRADHSRARDEVPNVKQFHVRQEDRDALIERLAPMPPREASEPLQSIEPPAPTPMPSQAGKSLPATNREIAESLLAHYKCFSSKQLPQLSDRSTKLLQLELNKLAGEGKCWKTSVGRLNIYADRENKQAAHDVERTDFLIAIRDCITRLHLDGIRDGINPDGYLESGNLCFFLEVERSNPRTEAGESVQIAKAREYDRYAMAGKHKTLCENFRVIFAVQTEAKARNLAEKIRQHIPNPARFWVTWKGNYRSFLSADGATHILPIVTDENSSNPAQIQD